MKGRPRGSRCQYETRQAVGGVPTPGDTPRNDLNVRIKPIELLLENTGGKLCDLGRGRVLGYDTKGKIHKRETEAATQNWSVVFSENDRPYLVLLS